VKTNASVPCFCPLQFPFPSFLVITVFYMISFLFCLFLVSHTLTMLRQWPQIATFLPASVCRVFPFSPSCSTEFSPFNNVFFSYTCENCCFKSQTFSMTRLRATAFFDEPRDCIPQSLGSGPHKYLGGEIFLDPDSPTLSPPRSGFLRAAADPLSSMSSFFTFPRSARRSPYQYEKRSHLKRDPVFRYQTKPRRPHVCLVFS